MWLYKFTGLQIYRFTGLQVLPFQCSEISSETNSRRTLPALCCNIILYYIRAENTCGKYKTVIGRNRLEYSAINVMCGFQVVESSGSSSMRRRRPQVVSVQACVLTAVLGLRACIITPLIITSN